MSSLMIDKLDMMRLKEEGAPVTRGQKVKGERPARRR
jgi:hypothetical protein